MFFYCVNGFFKKEFLVFCSGVGVLMVVLWVGGSVLVLVLLLLGVE